MSNENIETQDELQARLDAAYAILTTPPNPEALAARKAELASQQEKIYAERALYEAELKEFKKALWAKPNKSASDISLILTHELAIQSEGNETFLDDYVTGLGFDGYINTDKLVERLIELNIINLNGKSILD